MADRDPRLEAGMDDAQQLATLMIHGRRVEARVRLAAMSSGERTAVAIGLLHLVCGIHHAWSDLYKLDHDEMLAAWAQLLGDFQTLRDQKAAS